MVPFICHKEAFITREMRWRKLWMKRIIRITVLTIMVCLIMTPAYSQQIRATTEDGKEAVLYPDGTWKYVKTEEARPLSSYSKAPSANKVLKGKHDTYGIWIDEKKWRISEKQFSPQAEYSFIHTVGDGYAMIIYERIRVPLETLKEVALKNARNAAPDAQVILEERRMVNGNEILCMKIEGTIEMIPFIYYGYYYAGEAGTIQVITYTARNLFDEFESDFAEFLNGFEVYTRPQREEIVVSRDDSSKPTISYDDGSKYIGDIVNGKLHGQGTYMWPSGATYTGAWSNNMRHGQGTYEWVSGDKYVGAWENDRASGGWLYRKDGGKVWCYQDPQGNWIVKEKPDKE